MTYNVILAATSGRVSGVDVFSFNLVRGLQRLGIRAQVLLTEPYRQPPDPIPLPTDLPIRQLPVRQHHPWRARWRAMIRYLEQQAPCIYIPNYDWRHSCVSPRLSDRVGIVGIVHSDDPQHYEHVARLGRYWNAIVAVSGAVAEHTRELDPTFAARMVTIPYGVEVPAQLPERPVEPAAPLRIVYAGRLVQEQKRVLDLPPIMRALADRKVPVALTIVGGGADQVPLREACAKQGIQGHVEFLGLRPNDQVLEILAHSDVFLLTSEFEGLPVSLLEAMAQGCVPVVTDISSGIPELIQEGVNGYRLPVGNILAFAERLAALQEDVTIRKEVAAQAYHTVLTGGYTVENMVQRYALLFERVLRDAEREFYHRPAGKILPPPSLEFEASWTALLPRPMRSAGGLARRLTAFISRRLSAK